MRRQIVLFAALTSALLASCDRVDDISLPGERAYPESVISDAAGGFFVSNIADGGVTKITDGTAERFIEPGVYGGGSLYGLFLDAPNARLWACANDLGDYGLARTQDRQSALIGFDLRTGTVAARFPLPGQPAECNDMAAGRDGSIYVTDTAQPRILRLKPDRTGLELLITDPLFEDEGGGADGIALGADGNLYVNTLGSGKLLRIDMEAGKATGVTQLKLQKPLKTADGMRHERGNRFLVASGNGLDRLEIRGDQVSVETLQVKPALVGATGFAIQGGHAFVAEGQFSRLFGSDQERRQPAQPFVIRAVPLAQD